MDAVDFEIYVSNFRMAMRILLLLRMGVRAFLL